MANKLNESVERIVRTAQSKGIKVSSEELMKIIKTHAGGAAAATMAAGALPGVGSTIALGIETGFAFSMFYRICNSLGISVQKELLKSVGTAFVTYIAGNMAFNWAAGTVFSLIPGIGTLGAVTVVGLMGYTVTYYSGIVFMNLLNTLLRAGKSVDHYSADELKEMLKAESKKTSMSDVKNEAKEAFKTRKEDGVAELVDDDAAVQTAPAHRYWLHTGVDFGSTNSVMAWRLYHWTEEDGWQLDAQNNKENNVVRCPTMIVFKKDNPDHPVVQMEIENVIVGKRAEELANDNQEPAAARTNFKPVFYDAPEGSDAQKDAIDLVGRFLRHLYQLYKSEILGCLPNQVINDMCATVHLSTPVRAEKIHRDRMSKLAQEAGFTHDGQRYFVDTSRNEAECIMHLTVESNMQNFRKLMQISQGKSALNLLFIDVGGSTTDIELIKQEMHSAGRSTQVLAMWPRENVQYMLGGCEVDRAMFDYLVEEGCLIPRFAQHCWDHGTGKTLFRKLKENNNENLRAGKAIVSLGAIRTACGDPDEEEMPARKYKDSLITRQVFEERICSRYIESLCGAVHDVLAGKVGEDEVDGVFVTGAGSRLYFIHDLILGRYGSDPLQLAQIRQDESRLFDRYADPATCCAEGAISGVM